MLPRGQPQVTTSRAHLASAVALPRATSWARLRTLRQLCSRMKTSAPRWSKALKSAALQAISSCTQGNDWAPREPASFQEFRAAQSRQACPEEAQEPSWGTAKTAL
eukprot:scaffold22132_cov69-Phaeocystis_antarctica.AAC.5